MTLGLESNELEAIMLFKERAVEQGVEWEPGTERAQFMEYETREEEYTYASKIERTVFTAVATEYMDGIRHVPTGKVWVVLADEPKPKFHMSNQTTTIDGIPIEGEISWPDQ